MSDLKGGYSIDSYDNSGAGTIGVIYKNGGTHFLVSALHVLGPINSDIKVNNIVIGKVAKVIKDEDCSVAELLKSDEFLYTSGINTLSGANISGVGTPKLDDKVKMFSRVKGGWIDGKIICAKLEVILSDKTVLVNRLLVEAKDIMDFGGGGDSGSLLMTPDLKKVLGLYSATYFEKTKIFKKSTLNKIAVTQLRCDGRSINLDSNKTYCIAANFEKINTQLKLNGANFNF